MSPGWKRLVTGYGSCTMRCCAAQAAGAISPAPNHPTRKPTWQKRVGSPRNGDRSGALRQLERLERALRAGLGVTPGPAAVSLRAELLGLDSPQARAQRRPPPPLGRDAELGRIDRAIAIGKRRAKGGTLFVSGPAGIGKTTLLRWLEQRAEERGLRVGVGTAAAIQGAWPRGAPSGKISRIFAEGYSASPDGVPDDNRVQTSGRGAKTLQTAMARAARHQRKSPASLNSCRGGLRSPAGLAADAADEAHGGQHPASSTTTARRRRRLLIVAAHRPRPRRPPMEAMRRSRIGRARPFDWTWVLWLTPTSAGGCVGP